MKRVLILSQNYSLFFLYVPFCWLRLVFMWWVYYSVKGIGTMSIWRHQVLLWWSIIHGKLKIWWKRSWLKILFERLLLQKEKHNLHMKMWNILRAYETSCEHLKRCENYARTLLQDNYSFLRLDVNSYYSSFFKLKSTEQTSML